MVVFWCSLKKKYFSDVEMMKIKYCKGKKVNFYVFLGLEKFVVCLEGL